MINPMITPMLRSMINGDSLGEFRYFLDFDSTPGNTFLELAKPVTFAGDYKISASVFYQGADVYVSGSDSDFNGRVRVNSSGAILWRPSSSSTTQVTTGASVLLLNKLSLIEVERSGSNGTITINGSLEFSGAVETGDCVINVLGRNFTSFSDGVIANVDLDGEFYAISEPTADYELPRDNIFGSDTLIPYTSIGDDWTDNLDGSYTRVAGAANSTVSYSVADYTAGDAVSVTVDIEVLSSNQFKVKVQGGDYVTLPNQTGVAAVICIAGSSGSTQLRSTNAASAGTIRPLSVKSVTNAIIYNNAPESDRNQFVKVGDDWVGVEELVINGGFDTDLSSWNILNADGTHSVTWNAGTALYESDTTSPQLIFQQSNVWEVGLTYQLEVHLDVTSGVLKTNGAVSNAILADGANTDVIEPNTTTFGLTRNSGGVVIDIDNVSVKRLLQAP